MNYCPCCSHQLLRHIRSNEIYWFCRSCWQDMPVVSWEKCTLVPEVPKGGIKELPVRAKRTEKTHIPHSLNNGSIRDRLMEGQNLHQTVKVADCG
ncbi:hypothetical protein [Scytonema sp. NUACC21]